jgi:NAD-dependent SIR2 family protein deacetylase
MPFDKSQPSFISLRDVVAERTSTIVAWVGAGMSVPAGMPTWRELRERLNTALNDKLRTYSPEERKKVQDALMEAIFRERNPWRAFGMLQSALGQTSYRETIRAAFQRYASVDPPAAYRSLWKLRISGLLNLNIDKLATQAYILETQKSPL